MDVLATLSAVTNEMDKNQVSTGSRYLFITPTLRGVLDDFSASARPYNSIKLQVKKVVIFMGAVWHDERKLPVQCLPEYDRGLRI